MTDGNRRIGQAGGKFFENSALFNGASLLIRWGRAIGVPVQRCACEVVLVKMGLERVLRGGRRESVVENETPGAFASCCGVNLAGDTGCWFFSAKAACRLFGSVRAL